MSDRYSRLFARYAAGVDAEDLPDRDRPRDPAPGPRLDRRRRGRVRRGGLGRRTAVRGRDSRTDGATLWGTRDRAGLEAAGFANGVAVRCLDFNDTYLSREPLHPSDVIPPLVALAEARGIAPRASCSPASPSRTSSA